jgi:UDP-3-O-[3-hydroxymyristoyl] glucosamine N-acyltransferase
LYYLILSWPTLKTLVFRAFGYRGPMNFTIYPDTWLRDLPLVHFGEGSYLSNKATIGSNMIFIRNGKKMIEVGSVRVGNNALVGHLTMVGPSTVIEDDVQIGVGCGIGRRSHIGAGAIIGDVVVLDHGSRVDAGCVLPTRAYVGMGCRVRRETDVAPAGSILRKQSPQREPVTA